MMSPGELSAHRNKPDSQSSAGSNLPAWTALATTSDEEDGLRADSEATTPEPDDKPSSSTSARQPPRSQPRIGRSPQKAARGAFNPTQPFAVVNSSNDHAASARRNASTSMPLLWLPPPESSYMARPTHSPSKRKPTQSPLDASGKPPAKRRKHVPAANTIRIPPMKLPSNSTPAPGPPRIKFIFSAQSAPDNATVTQDNGEGANATSNPAGTPPRHARSKKQRLITDAANLAEGTLLDDALDTHVSTIRVLPQYAQSRKGDGNDVVRLHVALRSFQSGSVDKGKRRAHSPWSIPRWSKAGEFKERLDGFYGPGDVNRGLGKRPANVSVASCSRKITAYAIWNEIRVNTDLLGDLLQTKRPSADEDVFVTAPDATVPLDQSDEAAVSGTALTEDEDDTDALLQGMRRGRLENPSPGKGTRTSQRPATRDSSPEIV